MKLKEILPHDKVYFTSDTHFCHKNIIEYSSRPFKDVNEMNGKLVKNWNEVVPHDGVVFHLGDFTFGPSSANRWIRDSLSGTIHFIMGNHDKSKEIAKLRFASISDILEITVKDPEIGYQRLVLCHYAIASFNGAHKGVWHMFGHSHGTFDHPHPAAIDVGVDCWDYKPVSYEDVKIYLTKQMMKKKFKPVDHHGN